MRPDRIDNYIKEVQNADMIAQNENGHSVKRVLLGLEGEYFPDMTKLADTVELYNTKPFDFIIGSLHHHNSLYRELLVSRGFKIQDESSDAGIIESYFNDLKEMCTKRIFDVCYLINF